MMTVVAHAGDTEHAGRTPDRSYREAIGRMLVGEVIARAVRRYGDQVALEGPDSQRTFAQVGERVGWAPGCAGWVWLPAIACSTCRPTRSRTSRPILLSLSSGLVRVALNHRLRPADWEYIADDCGARALIYDARFADASAGLRSGMDHVVVIGDGPGIPTKLVADSLDGRNGEAGSPEDLVSLNYSSGTTGRPRGQADASQSVGQLAEHAHGCPAGEAPPMTSGSTPAPSPTQVGCSLCPTSPTGRASSSFPIPDPAAVLDAIEHRGGTATALVPTMVARPLALPDCTPDRTALRMLGCGAPMAPDQIRQAYDRITANLVQYYGLWRRSPGHGARCSRPCPRVGR
jgi:hypothetical protein